MIDIVALKEWLTSLSCEGYVAIDEGGLTVVEVGPDGNPSGAALEVGGLPEPDDDPGRIPDDTDYKAQSAIDAREAGYGGKSYWDYLERHAEELHAYYTAKGDESTARQMFTRSLSESLQGNEGA